MSTHLLYSQPNAAVGVLQENVLAEQVGNFITNLFPLDFQLQSWLNTRPTRSVYTQWPVDTFNDIARSSTVFAAGASPATSTIVKPESFSATSVTPQYVNKMFSVLQICGDVLEVSETLRATEEHGFTDRYLDAVEKKVRKVASDFELSFWHGPGTTPGGTDLDTGGTVYSARITQGLFNWIGKTGLQRTKRGPTTDADFTDGNGNIFNGSASNPNAMPSQQMTYALDLNGTDMDRGSFFDLMQNWKLIGGQPDNSLIFCAPYIKRLFSTFANPAIGPINERKVDAADRVIYDNVSAYETDWGMHFLNMSYFLQIPGQSTTITQGSGSTVCNWNQTLLAIMPRYFHIDTLRGISYRPFSTGIDAYQAKVAGEMGLACRNTLAGCGLFNAVTSV
jgi:hypothetical protein